MITPQVICTENSIEDRLDNYMQDHFDEPLNRNMETWAREANRRKEELASMLGLPHPNAALMFEASGFELDSYTQSRLLNMVSSAEPDEALCWENMDFDVKTLTYKNGQGKQRKLLRRLRKVGQVDQSKAFYSLQHIIGQSHVPVPPDSDGNYPFEKFWPKLGDVLKASFTIMITPDPIMLLGSGLFHNSGSCHAPQGQYEKGPFTYAYDNHTIAAFIFSSSEANKLSSEVLLTPYKSARWLSEVERSPCGRALGRNLYHIHDPKSYRIYDESQLELIRDSNFSPDLSTAMSGGKLAYFLEARAYGVMNASLQKDARHVIEKKLRMHKGIPVSVWKSVESELVVLHTPSFTYSDASTGKYIQTDDKGIPVSLAASDLPGISLGEPSCLICAGDFEDCGCVGFNHRCVSCECGLSDDDGYSSPSGELYCETCFHELFSYCERCDESYYSEEGGSVNVGTHEEYWCEYCITHGTTTCDECGDQCCDLKNPSSTVVHSSGDREICQSCYEQCASYCEQCDTEYYDDMMTEHNGGYYCPDCLEEVKGEEEEEEEEEENGEEEIVVLLPLPVSGESTVSVGPNIGYLNTKPAACTNS